MEYLVTMTTQVPDGVSESAVAAMRAREAAHTAELARDGRVVRLWRPPLRSGLAHPQRPSGMGIRPRAHLLPLRVGEGMHRSRFP